MARGSSVQEAISATAARAQLPDRSLAELARKEQDTLNRVVALNQLLARLASAPAQERLNKVINDMRAEIERLRQEHAVLRADIRKRYPEYAELIDPRPAGIGDVRKALGPGEALVAIYLGESQAYVWTIGAGGKAAFRVVPVKREEVDSEVRELRRAVDFGDGNPARLRPFDLARGHNLYRAFFELDEALWKEAQVLNVIPHGALGQLPMALLVTAASPAGDPLSYRDAPWLIRKVAIAQLPSASAFTALRRAAAGKAGRQPFIGFGDPLFTTDAGAEGQAGFVRKLAIRKVADRSEDQINAVMRGGRAEPQATSPALPTLSRAFALLSALPDKSDELKEIAVVLKADPSRDVYVNRQATEKNVKQAGLENRRVVAFATHGIAPGELTGLDQPALALSNPAITGDTDNDGFLTMEEVLGLKLDADWVVLSACNTASADGRGSEAVSGLGRAFFYAGARSLLVSNWAVETTSARLLTTELFKRQAENPSLTRAEALRQSMLSLMGKNATDATGRATFSYAHPAFWAPFSLVGDGGR
jgi:CHAT domain-containing protein